MKLMIFLCSLLLSSILWADSYIYCPAQLICKNGTCTGAVSPFYYQGAPPSQDGTYLFVEAGGSQNIAVKICTYAFNPPFVSPIVHLGTSAPLMPPKSFLGTYWVMGENLSIPTCSVSPTQPGGNGGTNYSCPFVLQTQKDKK